MDFAAKNLNELNQRLVGCERCPRLVAYRQAVGHKKKREFRDWEYWSRPIPGFGDPHARLLIVGLAPGAHGSNRTGRVFTGDASGEFLYRSLHKYGFASQPKAMNAYDGLTLNDIYITAVCRCVPPDNKPLPVELETCRSYLEEEIGYLPNVQGVVLLGRIAMDGMVKLYRQQGYTIPRPEFAHGQLHDLGNGLPWWITSYHPSRQNTQTGRLTEAMFDSIWEQAASLLN